MGHSQGYTQRGYMFIHCESRGTWACVSVYWSSALKSWLCLWKIVSMKERSCTYQIPTEFKCSFMTWRKTYLFVCFIVEMKLRDMALCSYVCRGGGFASYCALFDSCGLCERKNFTQISNSFLLLLSFLLPLTRLPDLLPPRQQGPSALDYSGGGVQCSAVHRHRTFLWAELRFPTHCSHCRGLGCRTGSCGCYHWTQR